MIRAIKCKEGNIFAMCLKDYADAEWKLQEYYYRAQGCEVVELESGAFGNCGCEHCQSLEHEFENLMEEIKEEYE